jgi:hypothetical protein
VVTAFTIPDGVFPDFPELILVNGGWKKGSPAFKNLVKRENSYIQYFEWAFSRRLPGTGSSMHPASFRTPSLINHFDIERI